VKVAMKVIEGVYDGVTLSKVSRHVNRVISVDIKDLRKEKVGEFHMKTTDEFFTTFNEKIDVIFIDADHNFESVKKDFKNSVKLLNKYGMIILHDTDPMEEMYLNPNYCGDSYKMDEWIRENYTEFDIMTLPLTQAGLTIVKRKIDKRVNNFLK
jgi:predicted O-methyltransferase YrrM